MKLALALLLYTRYMLSGGVRYLLSHIRFKFQVGKLELWFWSIGLDTRVMCVYSCTFFYSAASSDSYDLTQKSETSAEDTVPLVSENDDNVSTELEN